jgi:hypothetical protein
MPNIAAEPGGGGSKASTMPEKAQATHENRRCHLQLSMSAKASGCKDNRTERKHGEADGTHDHGPRQPI